MRMKETFSSPFHSNQTSNVLTIFATLPQDEKTALALFHKYCAKDTEHWKQESGNILNHSLPLSQAQKIQQQTLLNIQEFCLLNPDGSLWQQIVHY